MRMQLNAIFERFPCTSLVSIWTLSALSGQSGRRRLSARGRQAGAGALLPQHRDVARVLVVLSANGGQLQVDLGGLTSMDASTLSCMVKRLVRLGFVARRRSTTDNREVEVGLAAKGRDALRQLVPVARRHETARRRRHRAPRPSGGETRV